MGKDQEEMTQKKIILKISNLKSNSKHSLKTIFSGTGLSALNTLLTYSEVRIIFIFI